MMGGAVQVRPGASMMAHSSRPNPAMDSSMPTGSGCLAWTFRELGTRKIAASPPAAAMGTLMRKTDPHQ